MNARRSPGLRCARGFTAVELLTVLALVAILAAVALPALADVATNQRLRAAGTDMMSSLLMARSEAIKRNAQVDVKATNAADWSQGWVVSQNTPAATIRKQPALGNIVITPSSGIFSFDGNGRMTTTGATFAIAPTNKTGSQPLCLSVTVGATGRVESTKVTCP